MEHWAKVGREWLLLDGSVRFELLDKYPEFFSPIQEASMSSVTYYAEIIKVSVLWEDLRGSELKDNLRIASPGLKRALKGLAIMVSDDDKAFVDL